MSLTKYALIFTSTFATFCINSIVKGQNMPTYQVSFFNGSSNNKLEVLDWGGTGRPILFLSGLGNTAHVFVDFAPRFTNRFHVYALTRRGFGASAQPLTGYSIGTLVADILAVIDSLHLNKVILIGHSIAGEEITKFAASYPDRVNKIIYMDAAYDFLTIGHVFANYPQVPKAVTEDSSSFQSWRLFNKNISGISYPSEEDRQIYIYSKAGKYIKTVTPDSIVSSILAGIEHPAYNAIKCKALAIYAFQASVNVQFPFYSQLDPANKQKADISLISSEKWGLEELNRFKKEVKNGTVKKIKDATHYIFISNKVETEKLIRDFLQ